jgi:hypothetical protein
MHHEETCVQHAYVLINQRLRRIQEAWVSYGADEHIILSWWERRHRAVREPLSYHVSIMYKSGMGFPLRCALSLTNVLDLWHLELGSTQKS